MSLNVREFIKKAIVFGADGYIGRHLAHSLVSSGVTQVSRYDRSDQTASSTIVIKKVDIVDIDSLAKVDWDVDVVFMFAGLAGTVSSFEFAERFVQVNQLGLLNILRAIRNSRFRPRIVFPSSRLVYKGDDLALSEESKYFPKTIYAVNKLACEQMLSAYSNNYKIDYTIYRICVPYGSVIGNNYSFGTIGRLLQSAMSTRSIRLYGDGSLRRTFTHIQDLCDQIIGTCYHPRSRNQIYNILGEEICLGEVAQRIAGKFSALIEYSPFPEEDLRIETGHTVFDASKIQQDFGVTLKHNFSTWLQGLDAT